MLSDLGKSFKARVHVDASVANSICERKGIDKLRHLAVNNLWLQEQQARERAPLHKVAGKVNVADLMTNTSPVC